MRGRLNLATNGHGRYASPYLSSEIPNTGHTADLPALFPEHSWPTPYQSETQAHQGETSYAKAEFSPDADRGIGRNHRATTTQLSRLLRQPVF